MSTNHSTEIDRSISAVIARLRFGDSDGDDHDVAADALELLADERDTEKLKRLQALHERDCAVEDVKRMLGVIVGYVRAKRDGLGEAAYWWLELQQIANEAAAANRTEKLRAALADTGVQVTVLGAHDARPAARCPNCGKRDAAAPNDMYCDECGPALRRITGNPMHGLTSDVQANRCEHGVWAGDVCYRCDAMDSKHSTRSGDA